MIGIVPLRRSLHPSLVLGCELAFWLTRRVFFAGNHKPFHQRVGSWTVLGEESLPVALRLDHCGWRCFYALVRDDVARPYVLVASGNERVLLAIVSCQPDTMQSHAAVY